MQKSTASTTPCSGKVCEQCFQLVDQCLNNVTIANLMNNSGGTMAETSQIFSTEGKDS